MKSLTSNSITLVTFTRLEVTEVKKNEIVYKIDTGSDENLMSFRIFRILFHRLIMSETDATINKLIVLKIHIISQA